MDYFGYSAYAYPSEDRPGYNSEDDLESLLNFEMPTDIQENFGNCPFGMLPNETVCEPQSTEYRNTLAQYHNIPNLTPLENSICESRFHVSAPHPNAEAGKAVNIRSNLSPVQPYSRPATSELDRELPEKPISRRGRPIKCTSDSKMAGYARAYREQKKEEERRYAHRIDLLEAENNAVRQENLELAEKFNKLVKDYEDLRRVLEHDPLFSKALPKH